jgi:hypothetical protein
MRMGARYGHAWASQYGDKPDSIAGAEWAETLHGLTLDQLATGVTADAARGAEFPPSSPSFRAMCLEIPSYARLRAAIGKPCPSRFVMLVRMNLDMYRFARAEQSMADRMLRDAYEAAREHVMAGGALPEPPVAQLAAPTRKRTDEERARDDAAAAAHIATLADLFGSMQNATAEKPIAENA